MKRIAYAHYGDITIQQQYTKSVMEKYPYGRPLNARGKGGAGAAAAFIIPDPTGGFIAAGLLVAAITVSAAEADVAKKRSDRLNATGLHANVPAGIHKTIQDRITKFGYAMTPVAALKYEDFDPTTPVRLGRSMPTLSAPESKKIIRSYEKQGELLLILNTLTMGIEQRDRFGKKPTFHPFVVIGVRGYDTKTAKIVAKYELVSVAPNPLPADKDLDTAIADKSILKKAYDDAIQLAIEEISGDFEKVGATLTAAKPAPKAKAGVSAK